MNFEGSIGSKMYIKLVWIYARIYTRNLLKLRMSFGHVARIEIWIKSNYAPLIGFSATSTYINSQHFGLSAYILTLHMPLWPQHNHTIITSIQKKRVFSIFLFTWKERNFIIKVQRADLTCHVISVMLQQFKVKRFEFRTL